MDTCVSAGIRDGVTTVAVRVTDCEVAAVVVTFTFLLGLISFLILSAGEGGSTTESQSSSSLSNNPYPHRFFGVGLVRAGLGIDVWKVGGVVGGSPGVVVPKRDAVVAIVVVVRELICCERA